MGFVVVVPFSFYYKKCLHFLPQTVSSWANHRQGTNFKCDMCGKLKYLAEKVICRQRCYDGLYELNNRYAVTNKVRSQLWRACQGEMGGLVLIFMALSSHPTIIWETTLGSTVMVFWATFGVCGSSQTICSVCHITRGQYWKAL